MSLFAPVEAASDSKSHPGGVKVQVARRIWHAVVAVAAIVLFGVHPLDIHTDDAHAAGAELNLPEAQTFASTGTFFAVVPDGNGNVLSGFTGDVQAVLSVDSGSLRIGGSSTYSGTPNFTITVDSSTVDVPGGYRDADAVSAGSGVTELAIEGSLSDVNIVLAELEFSRGSAGTATLSVSAVKADTSRTIAYDPDQQHYYEFLSNPLNWQNARCAAKFDSGSYDAASNRYDKCNESNLTPRTFNGYTGYLATVTSATENTFVKNKAGSSAAWVGGSDLAVTRLAGSETNINPSEQVWRWVDGPEAGKIFWQTGCTNDGSVVTTCVGADASTQFSYWNSNEPNDSGGEEALQLLSGGSGQWNDLPWNSSTLPFIVEYGGTAGESATEEVDTSVALSVAQDGPPTNLAGTAGDRSARLSWTAPVIVTGTTVSSYTVTSTPDSQTCTTSTTSCTVSGLTNGTAYTFVVEVTFADTNTRTSSSSSTVTPDASLASSEDSSDDDDDDTPGVNVPATGSNPAVGGPRRAVTPPQSSLPVIRQGPVLRNGVVPRDVRAPEVRIGGLPTSVQSTVTDPSNLSVRAGVVSLGVQVQQDEGSVSQSDDGTTEIAVRKGAKTTLSGEGLRPESTVQVFLPLQGGNAKELTRIPVGPDGSFSGDAVFATQPDEDPLPVGRQVLQLVSVDGDGNEVVVNMTVNIAQPPPAPELNRVEGVIPTLTPGSSIATNAGVPEQVRVSAVEEQKLAVVEGDGWSMAIGVAAEDGGVQATDGGASLTLVRNESARVSGDGFMPGTRADVWLFSEPTLLGTVTIDDEGRFDGEVNIDGRVIAVGNHTLQLQGVGEDGYVRAANLGVTVGDPAEVVPTAEENSLVFIWWVLAAVILIALMIVVLVARRRREQN